MNSQRIPLKLQPPINVEQDDLCVAFTCAIGRILSKESIWSCQTSALWSQILPCEKQSQALEGFHSETFRCLCGLWTHIIFFLWVWATSHRRARRTGYSGRASHNLVSFRHGRVWGWQKIISWRYRRKKWVGPWWLQGSACPVEKPCNQTSEKGCHCIWLIFMIVHYRTHT